MALTLNTGHPLYGNLLVCIGIDNGVLVDLVGGETFTPAAGTSFGTGTYGEHFRSIASGFTATGATISPALNDSTNTYPNQTAFAVFNNIVAGNETGLMNQPNSLMIGVNAAGKFGATPGEGALITTSTTTVAGAGALTVAATRTSETAHEIFVNAVSEGSGGQLGWNGTGQSNYFMGNPGNGSIGADIVWFVKFDKVLTPTEISDLHTSLGASNQFALVTSGADTTAPTFSVAPATSNIQQTQADISATIDEIGSIYWVVVPQGDTNPTVTEVLNGQASGGGVPVDSGSALAGTTLSDTAIGLTASTAYKFVLVAQDDEPTPNVQASVTVVNFSTIAANGILSTPSALKNNAGTVQSSVTNITARVYNQTTGALVVELTGLSSDGSGMLSFNDPLIIPATTYNVNLIAGTTTGLTINRAFFPATAT